MVRHSQTEMTVVKTDVCYTQQCARCKRHGTLLSGNTHSIARVRQEAEGTQTMWAKALTVASARGEQVKHVKQVRVSCLEQFQQWIQGAPWMSGTWPWEGQQCTWRKRA